MDILQVVIVGENLQQEAADDARDSDEEIDHNEADVGGARLPEPERGWVHHGGDRPSEIYKTVFVSIQNIATNVASTFTRTCRLFSIAVMSLNIWATLVTGAT